MPNDTTGKEPPSEVRQITAEIKRFFDQNVAGTKLGSCNCAVYAFFDYDLEPIYVGQSVEGLRGRVSRHLTGRRSDAVAKFVLDPFEVLEIEVWPIWTEAAKQERAAIADRLEYAVFEKCLAESEFGAVLNEGAIHPANPIGLPISYRARIIPELLYEERKHPDTRIARRATTIASLARLISERTVGKNLRATLLVQAKRLEGLANSRYLTFAAEPDDANDNGAD